MARKISLTAALTAGILAISGAPAMAGSTASGYDSTGVLNEVDVQVLGATAKDNGGSGPESAVAPTSGSAPAAGVTPAQPVGKSSGELPFTGFDLGIVLLLGALLLGTGFAVRRSTRSAA